MAPASVSLLLLVILGVSWAQREVTMQQGPLYRTVGSHITIWCGVSGYQGPSQQNFLWSIYLPSAPEQEVQIVSTKDPGFSYAIYSQRVSSGNIYVERVTGDHALLHISQLEERDAGEYECHTPNTDPTYHGSYSAKMYLSVIPDTLKVTMASQELRKTEGDNMELTCNVSKASAQHTHVSVTWLYREGTQILTLSRDFVLQPGPKYAERFSRGDIRLDKLEDTMYKLSMRGLQDTDQGDVICQASEWIQDPDGIWTAITTKQSDTTNVIVSAVSGQDFDVDINVPKVPITPGSPLELSCSISPSNPDGKAFQVTWLLNDAILGIWYPSGISRFNKQHRTQKVPEQVVIGRSSLVTWYLRINQAQPEDAGHYVCEVLEDKGLLGTTKKKRSSSVPVTVTQTELKVRLSADVSQVYEGDSVSLLCEVTSFTGSVSLIWYKLGSLGQRMEMASIQREGELTLREGYNQHLQANKLAQGSFSVKISRMTGTARYGCQVTSWLQEVYGSWRNVTTHSSDIEISVISLGSSLTTTLSIRNPKVVIGDSVRLICKASASYRLAHRTLFWTWYFLPHSDSTGSYRQMVHMSQNGSMSWGEKVPIFQGNSQLQVSENTTELRIYRVQKMQAGSFSCTIGIIDKETGDLQASSSSNKVMIQVRVPDSNLMVDTTARDMEVSIGQDQITIPCNIQTMTPGSVPSITWFIHKSPATSKLEILNVSRDGMVAHSSAFWPPSHMSRFHSEKNLWNSYLLHILRPDPSLTGSFHCAVQEWLQEEGGKWTQLGEKNSGVTTVAFRLSEKNLNIPKSNRSICVMEAEDAVLPCPLGVVPSSASLYSVSWFYHQTYSHLPRLLYRVGWEGVPEYKESLAKRLHLVATNRGNYSLVLLSAGQEDAGIYYCHIEEWRLETPGEEWRIRASDVSGFLDLKVTIPNPNLVLNLTELFISVPENHQSISLPCQVLSRSSNRSIFSVSWWRSPRQLLFKAERDGLFGFTNESEFGSQRLQFVRLSELNFQLRILHPCESDSGIYYCIVQEWVQSPRSEWHLKEETLSANISVTLLPAAHTFQSRLCSSPSLLYFLVIYPLLLLILVGALMWVCVRVRRKRKAKSYPYHNHESMNLR